MCWKESDVDIIAGTKNNFGFRADDYGDDYTKSEPVTMYDRHISVRGMINSAIDKDAFSILIDQRVELQLNLVPGDPDNPREPTIQATLLNEHGEIVAQYDPVELRYIGIDKMLEPGRYYLIVNEKGGERFDKPMFYALSGSLIAADQLKQFARAFHER